MPNTIMNDAQAQAQALVETCRHKQTILHRKIDECREWWRELAEIGQPRFGEMNDRLSRIRDLLESHFEYEERSGFLQEVARMRPDHAERCRQLLDGHRGFLERLDQLCSKLSGDEPQLEFWGDAQRIFEEFLNDLESHEREETALLELWNRAQSDAG
jgi:hypothetical protein